MSADQPFHPVVKELLRDMQGQQDGSVLSREDLLRWLERMEEHRGNEQVATHLIVLINRFLDAKATRAAAQLFFLAVVCLGDDKAAQMVEASAGATAAKELAAQAKKEGPPMSRGMTPPAASGVGLRKKKR